VPDPPAPHAARPKAIERETTALRAADRENTSINTPSKSRRLASGGFSPAHFRTRQFARVQSTYALVFWGNAAIPYDFRVLQRNASSQQEDDRSSAPRVFSCKYSVFSHPNDNSRRALRAREVREITPLEDDLRHMLQGKNANRKFVLYVFRMRL
jgi:hypothetical protein